MTLFRREGVEPVPVHGGDRAGHRFGGRVIVEDERRLADLHGLVPPHGGDLLAADDRFVVLLVEVDGPWGCVDHAPSLPHGTRSERAPCRAEDSAIEEDRQLAIGLGDLGELHGDRSERP